MVSLHTAKELTVELRCSRFSEERMIAWESEHVEYFSSQIRIQKKTLEIQNLLLIADKKTRIGNL